MIFGVLGFLLSLVIAFLLLDALGYESYTLLFLWIIIGILFYVIRCTWGGGGLNALTYTENEEDSMSQNVM